MSASSGSTNPLLARGRELTRAAARELTFTLRCALSPLDRLRPLPQARADATLPPTVVVHGYMANRDMMRPLARHLLSIGSADVLRVSYPSVRWDIDRIVEHIAAQVDELAAQWGHVDLIGHSLGAVASRAFLKLHHGHTQVRRFVSLGGPHRGTSLYRLVPSPVRPVFDPHGDWVTALNEGEEPVPTLVIRSRYDQQVFPPERATIPGVREHILADVGHNGLLWSREAQGYITEFLAAPTTDAVAYSRQAS